MLGGGEETSGFRNRNSHLCSLVTVHPAFSIAGRGRALWSREDAHAALGYAAIAFQLRVLSASVPVHSHCRAPARLTVILKGG